MSLPNVSANPRWIYRNEGNRLFLALFKGLEFLSGFLKGNIYIYLHIYLQLLSPSPELLLKLLATIFYPLGQSALSHEHELPYFTMDKAVVKVLAYSNTHNLFIKAKDDCKHTVITYSFA